MSAVVMVMLTDGLAFPSGEVSRAPYSHLIYFRVPEDWVEGEIPDADDLWLKGPTLNEARMESWLQHFYGANWRLGNEDGSQYVVLGLGSRLLNPRHASETPWLQDDTDNKALRFLHYIPTEDGQWQRVTPSDL